MDDSKARVRQMLDYAFGDLLGFLPSNFAIGMAFAAIANCRGDNGINLVGIGQMSASVSLPSARYDVDGAITLRAHCFGSPVIDQQGFGRIARMRLINAHESIANSSQALSPFKVS